MVNLFFFKNYKICLDSRIKVFVDILKLVVNTSTTFICLFKTDIPKLSRIRKQRCVWNQVTEFNQNIISA